MERSDNIYDKRANTEVNFVVAVSRYTLLNLNSSHNSLISFILFVLLTEGSSARRMTMKRNVTALRLSFHELPLIAKQN